MLRVALLGLTLCFCLGATEPAYAGPARKAVENMRKAALKGDIATLDAHVDYRAVAQAALQERWKDFTEAEQAQFLRDFRTLVQRAYVRGLGGKKQYPFRVAGETKQAGRHIVHTHVQLKPDEPELAVDYAMGCSGEACKLQDVVTDGSSLVDSWRRMFRRIIKKQGKAELLRRLARKAAEAPPGAEGK